MFERNPTVFAPHRMMTMAIGAMSQAMVHEINGVSNTRVGDKQKHICTATARRGKRERAADRRGISVVAHVILLL